MITRIIKRCVNLTPNLIWLYSCLILIQFTIAKDNEYINSNSKQYEIIKTETAISNIQQEMHPIESESNVINRVNGTGDILHDSSIYTKVLVFYWCEHCLKDSDIIFENATKGISEMQHPIKFIKFQTYQNLAASHEDAHRLKLIFYCLGRQHYNMNWPQFSKINFQPDTITHFALLNDLSCKRYDTVLKFQNSVEAKNKTAKADEEITISLDKIPEKHINLLVLISTYAVGVLSSIFIFVIVLSIHNSLAAAIIMCTNTPTPDPPHV